MIMINDYKKKRERKKKITSPHPIRLSLYTSDYHHHQTDREILN